MPLFSCFFSHLVFHIWKLVKVSVGKSCVWCERTTTWMGSHQPQEEEVFTSQTSYQGQGQGQGLEVETSSIACCFGGRLSAQIKHSRKSKYSEYDYFVQTFQEQSSMSDI